MKFTFLPVEKQAGIWRAKWVALIIWVVVINLAIMMSIYLLGPKPLALRHPVVVKEPNVIIYSQASTGATSHVETAADRGDLLELHSMQPNGWCYVTQRSTGLSGYIQQSSLLIPDSINEAARNGLLSK